MPAFSDGKNGFFRPSLSIVNVVLKKVNAVRKKVNAIEKSEGLGFSYDVANDDALQS